MDINKQPLTLILPVETINVVLNAIGNLPYITAAPIIEVIQKQAQVQLDKLANTPADPEVE